MNLESATRDQLLAEVRRLQGRLTPSDTVPPTKPSLALLDEFPTPIWQAGTDGKCNYFNKAWLEFTGRTAEQESGDGWSEGIHPEDRRGCLEAYQQALASRSSFTLTYRLRRADGQYRWIEDHGRPWADAHAEFGGYIGSCYDITKRVNIESDLRRKEAMLDESQLLAHIGSWNWDIPTNTAEWSDENYRIFGLRPQDVPINYERFLQCLHPDDRTPMVEAIKLAMRNRVGFERLIRVLHPDGNLRIVHSRAQLVCGPEGNPVRMFGTSADVTAQLKAEERVRETEARFRQLVDNIEGYFWLNSLDDSQMYYMSPGWERITGRPCESLYQNPHSWSDGIHPLDCERVLPLVSEPLGSERQVEYRIVRPDGCIRWVRDRAFPVRDDQGNICRVAGIGEDITLRKEAEEKLAESYQRVQALSRQLLAVQEVERRHLARELHDEIGQDLTELRILLDENTADSAALAGGKLRAARSVVEALLARVREISFDLRPAMLDHLGLLPALLWLFERFSQQTNVQAHFRHEGLGVRFAPEIETTAFRLVQESFTNAARHAGVSEVSVRLWVQDCLLFVQVEDAGVGFDLEAALTSKTNAGLAGMQERVQLLGGRLNITSARGEGTQVMAVLPITHPTEGRT